MYKLLLSVVIIPAMLSHMNMNPAPQAETPPPVSMAPNGEGAAADGIDSVSTPNYFVADDKIGNWFGLVGDIALYTGYSDGYTTEQPFYAQNLTTGEVYELFTLENVVVYTNDTVCLQDRYLYFVMAGDFRVFIEGYSGNMPEYEHRILCFDSVEMTLEVVATYQAMDGLVYLRKVDDTRFLFNRSIDTDTALTSGVQLFDTEMKAFTTVCTAELMRDNASLYWSMWNERAGSSPFTGERTISFDYNGELVYALKAVMGRPITYRFDVYDLIGNFVRTIPVPQMDGGYYRAELHSFPWVQSIRVSHSCVLFDDFNPESAIVHFDENGALLPYATWTDVALSGHADFNAPLVFLGGNGNHHYVLNNAERSLRKALWIDSEAYSEAIYNFENCVAVVSWIHLDYVEGARQQPHIKRIRFFDSPLSLDAALITAED